MTKTTFDIQSVLERCGQDVADELVRCAPGGMVYVPKINSSPVTQLRLMKPELLKTLMRECAGETIYVPSVKSTRAQTFERIERLVDQGFSVQRIAATLGISDGWVRKCRQSMGAPSIPEKRRQQKHAKAGGKPTPATELEPS